MCSSRSPRQVSAVSCHSSTYSRRMSDPGLSKKFDSTRQRSSMNDCYSHEDEMKLLRIAPPTRRNSSSSSSSSSVSTTGSSKHVQAKTTTLPNNTKPNKKMTMLNPCPSPPPPPRRAVSHGSALTKHLTRGRQLSLSEDDMAATQHQRSHSSTSSSSAGGRGVSFSSAPVDGSERQPSTSSCSGSSSVNSSACTKSLLKTPKYKISKEKMLKQLNDIKKVTTMSMDLSSFSLDLNIEGDVTRNDLGDSYDDSFLDVVPVVEGNKQEYGTS